MRRTRPALFALASAGLLAAALVGPVAADTEPAPIPLNVYLAGTGFSFTAGGLEYSGIGQLEEERITHQTFVSFFFSANGAEKPCGTETPDDPDDDYVGTEYIEFYAAKSKIETWTIRKDLGRAQLSISVKGPRSVFDACTGELVRTRTEKHTFSFDLRATEPGAPETDVQVVTTDDGTFEITSTFEYRPAAGTVKLDGRRVQQSDGAMDHTTQKVKQLS